MVEDMCRQIKKYEETRSETVHHGLGGKLVRKTHLGTGCWCWRATMPVALKVEKVQAPTLITPRRSGLGN